MVNDPYCTLEDAKEAYDEQLRIEEEERIERERRTQETLEAWSESFRERRSSSGGFFGNMMSTAGGVALGNKMSGNGSRRDGKKDLFGTSVCQRCNSRDVFKQTSCSGCPAAKRCTKQIR